MNIRCGLALLAVIAGAACGRSIAGPSAPIVIQPIEIQSVTLNVGFTRPALVTARIEGTLGSGCDYLHSIEQRREASGVTIEIKRSRLTGVACTQQLKEFREELALPGGFDAGEYVLRVNGVSRTFTVS